jgi:predicted dinucleotide-binding enzyme
MNIAIIGSGNVGGALARQWIKAGHQIRIGAQFPLSDKNLLLAAQIGKERFTSIPEAIQQSEVVLLAIPPAAIEAVSHAMGDVSGKTLIDATNTMAQSPTMYDTVYHFLAATTNAAVVKCFNSTGFENMLDPVYEGKGIDMFMAGDDAHAKKIAHQLALDAGFGACIDFGLADKVLLLEQFAKAWINLAIWQKHGRNIAFRVVSR